VAVRDGDGSGARTAVLLPEVLKGAGFRDEHPDTERSRSQAKEVASSSENPRFEIEESR
jgi:hypothetical protein